MNDTLHTALRLHEKGFSVLPIRPRDKKPLIAWEQFQHQRASEEQLEEWFTKTPGANMAILTGQASGVDILDIDSPAGLDKMAEVLPELLETPRCRTPKGMQHVYFQHTPGTRRTIKFIDGCDFLADGGYALVPPSIGANGTPYAWLDGMNVFEQELALAPLALISLLKSFNTDFNTYIEGATSDSPPPQQSATSATIATLNFSEGGRDETLFHIAHSMLKGGMSPDNALICLEILASKCNPPFPVRELRAKIESARKRISNRERNLTAEIRDWVSATFGNFSATDLQRDATIATSEDRHKARTILGRLVDEGLIERIPGKNGWYRRIENDVRPMDFLNAPTEEVKFDLPLGVGEWCNLYPGNLVVVAGAKSAGKTAFLLECVRRNMGRYPIDYLNSEMGETELRIRLEAYGLPLSDWKFRPIARSRDWWDLIRPEDKITVIDYIEPPEDQIYLIGTYLRKIHEAMGGKGLCLIGLQKPPGRDQGRGGAFSMDKARLYLALDYDQEKRSNYVRIVDAKSWRTRENPRGMQREYKLVGGAKYEGLGRWHC